MNPKLFSQSINPLSNLRVKNANICWFLLLNHEDLLLFLLFMMKSLWVLGSWLDKISNLKMEPIVTSISKNFFHILTNSEKRIIVSFYTAFVHTEPNSASMKT